VPRHQLQFTVTSLIVAGAVVAVVAPVLIYLSSEDAWVGHASIPLEFVILDAPTGRPLEGASVRLVEWTPEYEASTGADGRANIAIYAMIGGRSSLVRKTRSVNYAWALAVTCGGHEGINQALSDVTRGPRYHSDSAPPPIVIRLARCH
jgi:hypothetical protein